MPRLNFEITEETARKARIVKASEDLTWPEFVDVAADCLAEEHGTEL